MLRLDHHFTLTEKVFNLPNLTGQMDERDLSTLGGWIWEGYNTDKQSRMTWERRTNAAMDLALQLVRDKNFPWQGCSNVAFPLVTIAALQFHSRAYPALVSAPDVVKCQVNGEDPDGTLFARAQRVAKHMSYQVLDEDKSWEEQHDALLINLPIVGCAFKKTFYNPRTKKNQSELVLARDLVLNYWSRGVDCAPRKTHVFPLSHNEIRERVLRKSFRDVLEETWYTGTAPAPKTNTQQLQADRRQGTTQPAPDSTTPFVILEQHVSADLDGDGYSEPYIITIEESSRCVLRIVPRWARWDADVERTLDGQIISIRATEYFTKYHFIPSPDGGIYDLGFGVLLGPINETVNDIINKLNDAGTMQVTAGGFLGRGAKVRGGIYTFAPFQWARVDSTGDDLRKSVFPLPVNAPSDVLFNLLNVLIAYADRIPGSTEIMVGETPGQNTPAETSRNALTQGLKLYSAIFKRVWRSMKEEFKKLYILNGMNMPVKRTFGDGKGYVTKDDYMGDPNEVCPVADPNITSDEMILQQVAAIKQSAATTPGYNMEEVEKRFLKALHVDGIELLYPGPEKMPPGESEKISIEKMRQQGKQQDTAAKLQDAAMERQWEQQKFIAGLMEEQRVNNAKIQELEASATALLGNIQGDREDRQIALINAELGMRKTQDETLNQRISLLIQQLSLEKAHVEIEHTKHKTALAKQVGESKATAAHAQAAAAKAKADAAKKEAQAA